MKISCLFRHISLKLAENNQYSTKKQQFPTKLLASLSEPTATLQRRPCEVESVEIHTKCVKKLDHLPCSRQLSASFFAASCKRISALPRSTEMSRRLAFYETDAARYPSTRYLAQNEDAIDRDAGEGPRRESSDDVSEEERERRERLNYPEDSLDYPDGYETDEDAWNLVNDDIMDDQFDTGEEDSDSTPEPIHFDTTNSTTNLFPTASYSCLPPSEYSPTSFLQPGVLFTGKQIFEQTTLHPPPIPSTSRSPFNFGSSIPTPSNTLYHSTGPVYESLSGPFVDYPSASSGPTSGGGSSTGRLAIARTALIAAEESRDVSQSTLARLRSQVRLLEVRNRLDMLSATLDSATVDDAQRNEMLEMRSLYLETLVPGASTQSGTGSLPRMLGTPSLTPFRRSSVAEEDLDNKAWDLKVYITTPPTKSTDSSFHEFSGIMSAYGVPNLSSPSPLVTTAFTGEIIDVRRRGLWSAKKWQARREDDLEYWGQLGPFKDLDSGVLRGKCDDFGWVQSIAEKWILMRWKENSFINVER